MWGKCKIADRSPETIFFLQKCKKFFHIWPHPGPTCPCGRHEVYARLSICHQKDFLPPKKLMRTSRISALTCPCIVNLSSKRIFQPPKIEVQTYHISDHTLVWHVHVSSICHQRGFFHPPKKVSANLSYIWPHPGPTCPCGWQSAVCHVSGGVDPDIRLSLIKQEMFKFLEWTIYVQDLNATGAPTSSFFVYHAILC